MKITTGIEGTFAPQSGLDTLSITGHEDRLEEDFALLEELGIQECRYPIPWHRVESRRGHYDWSFLDRVLTLVEARPGLSIIADTLHHTSYPHWLKKGFLSEEFTPAYVRFVEAFAERYPMVKKYTPFNEPTCTLDFCGFRGFWHPYTTGDTSYARMLENTARATAEVVQMLKGRNPETYIVHVDTFEHHSALDEESIARANFLNERRFLFEELLLGRVTPAHPLHAYLLASGFAPSSLAWHQDNPVTIEERGGNYYPLSEEQLRRGRTWNAPSHAPRGFAGVVSDYAARLPYRLSLTETNIQGNTTDRISWLKYMLEQCETLAHKGIALLQFAWYPLFDCAGWHCLLQGNRWRRDPQGIYSCDEAWHRVSTEFSFAYQRVVENACSAALPAYRFQSMHEAPLRGLLPQMNWDWQEPPPELCGNECLLA